MEVGIEVGGMFILGDVVPERKNSCCSNRLALMLGGEAIGPSMARIAPPFRASRCPVTGTSAPEPPYLKVS